MQMNEGRTTLIMSLIFDINLSFKSINLKQHLLYTGGMVLFTEGVSPVSCSRGCESTYFAENIPPIIRVQCSLCKRRIQFCASHKRSLGFGRSWLAGRSLGFAQQTLRSLLAAPQPKVAAVASRLVLRTYLAG